MTKGRVPLVKLSDRDILGELLSAQSSLARQYGDAALRSTHTAVRNEMVALLNEEHRLHTVVADEMEKRGYRSAAAADRERIERLVETWKQAVSAKKI